MVNQIKLQSYKVYKYAHYLAILYIMLNLESTFIFQNDLRNWSGIVLYVSLSIKNIAATAKGVEQIKT